MEHTDTQNIVVDSGAVAFIDGINNDEPDQQTPLQAHIDQACEQACRAIAPAWPLDRAIAVNPHWNRIGEPVHRVAARQALLGGVRVYPSRSYFQQAWKEGRITSADLNNALSQVGTEHAHELDESGCIDALGSDIKPQRLPLLIDLLDTDPGQIHRLSWRQAITHQVSQTCAAYFDEHQADWQPQRQGGLYAFWRDTLQHDHGIGILMGMPRLHRQLENLPETPELAEQWVLNKLGLPTEVWPDYLEALLLTMNGWASWCTYLQWQAAQENSSDTHLRELLAIRLAWGAILLDDRADENTDNAFLALKTAWADTAIKLENASATFVVEEVWQRALEAGYQRRLFAQLSTARPVMNDDPETITSKQITPKVQAAFCIDVRSEPLRRALEAASADIQTIGFAGFFGLPIAYTPMGTSAARPQLPGLLAPEINITDTLVSGTPYCDDGHFTKKAREARKRNFSLSEQWQSAGRWPAAAFSFVEAFGWAYGAKLGNWLHTKRTGRARDDLAGLPGSLHASCRPTLGNLDVDTRIEVAAKILHAMGLEGKLAPVVLLVGHGSQTRNNPQAAALDCGACCGQTGEVNARVLATMLNDANVRSGLTARGIEVPQQTVFVAALHNTTTDEIEWFDLDLLPDSAQPRITSLKATFALALHDVRKERAPQLGIKSSQDPEKLLKTLQRRGSDGAQTRPEWGLAGNAAFIIAPRSATHGLDLGGRSFLHDYDAFNDKDGSLLELLMTAPMLVTHWINWQYHASVCEPTYFGSGNKVLHNVVGGHIGVFEGNGGDLRIGLSRQSLHDGSKWMHEPLRLTVVIAAPRERIEAVIAKHAAVRHLVENGWLHLMQLDEFKISRYARGEWLPVSAEVRNQALTVGAAGFPIRSPVCRKQQSKREL
jgi:hypothetical protein